MLRLLGAGAGGIGAGFVVGHETASSRVESAADRDESASAGDQRDRASAGDDGQRTPAQQVSPTGATQPGVTRPATPQQFTAIVVADLPSPSPAIASAWLADLGTSILDMHERHDVQQSRNDLTVTVGIGPRIVNAFDPSTPAGTEPLPMFASDRAIDERHRGGDVCVQVCASEPSVIRPAIDALLVGDASTVDMRWSQWGYRGPGKGTVARNPLGFLDGVVVPATDDDQVEHVWIDGDRRVAGATIMVVRRIRLDVARFRGLAVEQQEAIIGRRRDDGRPLSGGEPRGDVDLDAKDPAGRWLIPRDAHVRAAHPSATGSHLMLRRSYSYDNGTIDGRDDIGLVFISHQRDLRTFVVTQRRLDDRDALGEFTTVTASASFLVLPGFTREAPLGSTLTGAERD